MQKVFLNPFSPPPFINFKETHGGFISAILCTHATSVTKGRAGTAGNWMGTCVLKVLLSVARNNRSN